MKQRHGRIDALDGLRGIAAVCVAFFYHLQNFGFVPPLQVWFLHARVLQWLQLYGSLGAHLFYSLSGFIFGTLYAAAISNGDVKPKEFFVFRLSRLYPLHIITMALAGIFSWAGYLFVSGIPIPGSNDVYHLFLQLFFMQDVGIERSFSFNSPSGTISAELLCYLAFFLICEKFPRDRELLFFVAMMVGISLMKINPPYLPFFNDRIAVAFAAFFGGCLISSAVNIGALSWLRWCALGILAYWIFTVREFGSIWASTGGWLYLTFDVVLLPCVLVCSLGFPPLRWFLSLPPVVYLGTISYSIYLLHFVVQIAILVVCRAMSVPVPVLSFWFYATFVSGVIVLGGLSHKFFEMPMQAIIRRRMLAPAVSPIPSSPPPGTLAT